MPKVRLYNRDVRFHSGNACNPLQFTSQAYQGHTAWTRITPMVWFSTDVVANRIPDAFTKIADRFAASGLTGMFGETGSASWTFSGTTAQNAGTSVAYIADMYRAFYARRGISDDGRYAWWPANIGYAAYNGTPFSAEHRQWALFPAIAGSTIYGSTADSLQLYTWTGSTSSQAAVLADSMYVVAGLSAFSSWVDQASGALASAVAARSTITGPALLAGEFESFPASSSQFFNNGNSNDEMGSWIQAINDPRATTYRFFDRHTLYDLWGSTGSSAQSFRSPFQRSYAFSVTACDGSGTLTVTGDAVDIIWSQRTNYLDYTPGWNNFYASFMMRHREHLLSRAWQPLRNRFANVKVGNYQNAASSRRFPDRSLGKIHSYTYTCDLGCTGIGSDNGYTASSITGTFALDYASPVLYAKVGDSQSRGYADWSPGYGYKASSFVYRNYLGAWGTGTLDRIGAFDGLFSKGGLGGMYANFLQHLSKQGITGTVGGGTAQGYTGNNILDLRNLWLQNAKNQVDSTRYSLNAFADNANKPIIPWLAASRVEYPSIFSLTASSVIDPTVYPDVNGLTNYSVPAYSPLWSDYNVNLIKYCIQTHNITDFFVFEPSGFGGLTVGLQSLDFWNDVIQTLIVDSGSSNTAPIARIVVSPSNDVYDNNNGGETLIVSGLSSSDANGDALAYTWSTSNGLTAVGATASFLFAVGTHTVNLTVADTSGATGIASTSILVRSNVAPTAVIAATPSLNVTDNDNNGVENITFSAANSSDPNGGSISLYAWTVDGAAYGNTVSIVAGLTVGSHTIGLMITDNGGLTAVAFATATVNPKPPAARSAGAPSGTSMMMFGGKIYSREEFNNLLQAFYPNLLR